MSRKSMTNAVVSMIFLLIALAGAAQTRIDEKRPAPPGGLVSVSNVSGSVTVKGWDKAEVAVTGTLGRGTDRLEFENYGDRTTIKVILPKHARDVEGSDLEIHVPAASRLDVTTVSADIAASDLSGAVSVQTVSGKLSATGPAKAVDAQSVSGDIKVDTSASRISAETVSGNVTVIASSSPQEVKLESVSGELSFDGGLAPGGSFDASTVSGNVVAALPAGTAADFSLGSFSGDLKSAFGDKVASGPEDHSGKRLNFTTGAGGARVRIKTFSGDVTVTKR